MRSSQQPDPHVYGWTRRRARHDEAIASRAAAVVPKIGPAQGEPPVREQTAQAAARHRRQRTGRCGRPHAPCSDPSARPGWTSPRSRALRMETSAAMTASSERFVAVFKSPRRGRFTVTTPCQHDGPPIHCSYLNGPSESDERREARRANLFLHLRPAILAASQDCRLSRHSHGPGVIHFLSRMGSHACGRFASACRGRLAPNGRSIVCHRRTPSFAA
jgi:hypothetical protein